MQNKLKNFFTNNWFNILLIALYIVITTVTMFYHEPWGDENTVWYDIRDHRVIDLYNVVRYEGHLFLWYSIITPFVKLGFNLFSLQVISLIFGILGVIFFVFKSPFNNFIKFLFVFCTGMVYFMPIIARPYTLIPLLIFIFAYLYPDRLNKPYKYLITLLLISQTHCIMWGFFIICSLLFIFEIILKFKEEKNKKILFIPFIILFNIIFLFLTYRDVFFNNCYCPELKDNFLVFSISDLLFIKEFFEKYTSFYSINHLVFYILILCCILLCVLFFKYDKKIFSIIVFSSSYILYIILKVWPFAIIYQKAFPIALLFLFGCWIIINKKDNVNNLFKISTALFFIFLFICPFSYIIIADDIKNTLTNTKEICAVIKKSKNPEIAFIRTFYLFNFHAYLPNLNYCTDDFDGIKTQEDVNNILDNQCKNAKYIVLGIQGPNITFGYPYKKIIDIPQNRVKYYDDITEHYELWENTNI